MFLPIVTNNHFLAADFYAKNRKATTGFDLTWAWSSVLAASMRETSSVAVSTFVFNLERTPHGETWG